MYAILNRSTSCVGTWSHRPASSPLPQSLAAMTIRFICDKCGSVLKIKDELAGTNGKCPKCKTRFVVPAASPEAEGVTSVPEASSEPKAAAIPTAVAVPQEPPAVVESTEPPAPVVTKPPSKPAHKPPTEKPVSKSPLKAAADDEFDPVSFLMEGPKKKPTFESDSDEAVPSPAKFKGQPGRNGGSGGGFSLDDDGSEMDLDAPPPTRKWGAKSGTSASNSEERSRGGSTNAAKDLLSRSMEESRVRASEMPEAAPRFNFDFAGFFREIGLKTGGTILGVIIAVYGMFWIMDRMMGHHTKLPPLGYVSGTVTIKGKPAAGVKVYLSPQERVIVGANEKKERARDSIGVTDAEGRFTVYYLPEIPGAKVGPCRLWMESMDPAIAIPPKYGLGSVQQFEVKLGKNESQKIEL